MALNFGNMARSTLFYMGANPIAKQDSDIRDADVQIKQQQAAQTNLPRENSHNKCELQAHNPLQAYNKRSRTDCTHRNEQEDQQKESRQRIHHHPMASLDQACQRNQRYEEVCRQ